MRIEASTPENSSQSSMAVSVCKAVGGVCGFAAVLAIHHMIVPSAVVETADGTLEPPSGVLIQTAPNNESTVIESAAAVLVESRQSDAKEAESALGSTSTLPADDATHTAPESFTFPEHTPELPVRAETNSETGEPVASGGQDAPESSDIPLSTDPTAVNSVELVAPTEVAPNDAFSANTDTVIDSVTPELQWSAVWRPFFSPTTAQGFAGYIADSTGLNLRVQPSPVVGHYLVEVQHRTEAERIDADRRIVETTGYVPPGVTR